jgi:hypothetical protein
MPTDLVTLTKAVRAFNLAVRGIIEDTHVYPRTGTWLDVTLGALLNRASNTVDSIAQLTEKDYAADADALSRIVVEIWIVVRWITNKDCHERAKRFGAFEGKLIQHAVEALKAHSPNLQIPQHTQHDAIVDAANQYRSHLYWAGTVRSMAEEPDEQQVTPAGDPINLNWFYDIPYFMTSWRIHSNAMGVRELYPEWLAPIRLKSGSDVRLCEQALVLATNCLTLILIRVGDAWGLNINSQVEALWRDRVFALL